MALFVPGIPCPLCELPMGSDDDVVLFPPFIADDADPLHWFSDATVHAACLARYPLGDEARRWSDEAVQAGERQYGCAACGQAIHDPDDYFGFGLLTRDPASPLYPYNFVHVHQQHVETWSGRPAVLAAVHAVAVRARAARNARPPDKVAATRTAGGLARSQPPLARGPKGWQTVPARRGSASAAGRRARGGVADLVVSAHGGRGREGADDGASAAVVPGRGRV